MGFELPSVVLTFPRVSDLTVTLLAASGVLFIGLSKAGLFGGGVKAQQVEIPKITRLPRIFSSVIGLILIGVATLLYQQNPAQTSTPLAGTLTPPPSPSSVPSPTPLSAPRFYDFAACLLPCDGSNSLTAFPAKTTIIHIAWKYENIPAGVHVVRSWEVVEKNAIWVTYDCTWTDPPTGNKTFSLYDVKGLTSGTWQLMIFLNDALMMQERLFIQGNWNYWSPAGIRHTCY